MNQRTQSCASNELPGQECRRVAFVAWQSYSAVFGSESSVRGVGGLETRVWTIAKGLAKQTAWSPTLVFRAASQVPSNSIDGVQLHAVVDRWESMRRSVSEQVDFENRRVSRFSFSLLWQAFLLAITWPWRQRDPQLMHPDPRLSTITSDVWVAIGVGKESAGVIATAKQKNQPSVLMLASGADLDERYANPEITYSPYGERSDVGRYAIENADVIVSQTNAQRERLLRIFGRHSELIRNPIDINRWKSSIERERGYVLWVGRYENFAKRIEMAIQVAIACPEFNFRMIVNPSDSEVELTVRSSVPSNVELIDYVPFEKMSDQYAAAFAFLSTSDATAEGFPNVLLQASASGVPIVALHDFDCFLAESEAGLSCGDDIQQAAKAIREFKRGTRQVDRSGVDKYLAEHFSLEKAVGQLDLLLSDLSK